MLEPNHFIDLQRNDESFEDPRSWLSQDQDYSSSNSQPNNNNNRDGNFDRVLFRNLVEMVPLVESLMVPPSSLHFLCIQKHLLLLSFPFFFFSNVAAFHFFYVCFFQKDRRPNASYSRRASLTYTRTPSRDSFPKKVRIFFFRGFFDFSVFVCILIWMLFWDAEFMVGWLFILVFVLERHQTHSRGLTRVFLFSLGVNINLLKVFRIID